MTRLFRYLTHEFIDAAGQQAKKQQQQQRKDEWAASTRERAVTADTTSEETAAASRADHSHDVVSASLPSAELSARVADDSAEDEIGWLAGEPTITPSHLAAVFQDNDEWAAVMNEFTFASQPHAHTDSIGALDSPIQPTAGQSIDTSPPSQPQPFPAAVHPPPPPTCIASAPLPTDPICAQMLPLTARVYAELDQATCGAEVAPEAAGRSTSIVSPVKAEASTTPQALSTSSARKQRGTRFHRPTLSACRGWAGGSKGDVVQRYQPVVRRCADGRIAVDNPFV